MTSHNPQDAAAAQVPQSSEQRADKKLMFTLDAGNSGGALVLHCEGRVIFRGEARELSSIVAEVLPFARRMVVNFSEIDCIDSGGLGELVLTHMWAEAAGYTLLFASPRRMLRELFEITNLASVLDVYASVPEAMAAMFQEDVQSA
jgi:anti-anti-sigma factor